MTSVGALFATLGLDATSYQSGMARAGMATHHFHAQLNSTSNRLRALGDQLTDIGMRLSIAVSAPLTIIGASALKIASDMEMAQIGFTQMLGSGEKAADFLRELQQFALRTPFEFPELRDQARRLMALGFAAERVVPILTTVGDAVAALGGRKDLIDRITLALGQMQAKGRVMAQEMNQLAEAGIPAWAILAKAIGTDIPTAMKRAEAGTIASGIAIEAFLAGMNERFAGLMAKSMTTIQGQWTNLKDRISFTLIDIGAAMSSTAKDMIGWLTRMTIKAQELAQSFAKLPEPIQRVTIALAALGVAIPLALTGLGGLISIGAGLGSLAARGAAAVGMFKNVAYAVGTGMTGALLASELVLLKVGIAAGIAALALRQLFILSEEVPPLVSELKILGTEVSKLAVQKLTPFSESIKSSMKEGQSDIQKFAAEIRDRLPASVRSGVDAIIVKLKELKANLQGGAELIGEDSWIAGITRWLQLFRSRADEMSAAAGDILRKRAPTEGFAETFRKPIRERAQARAMMPFEVLDIKPQSELLDNLRKAQEAVQELRNRQALAAGDATHYAEATANLNHGLVALKKAQDEVTGSTKAAEEAFRKRQEMLERMPPTLDSIIEKTLMFAGLSTAEEFRQFQFEFTRARPGGEGTWADRLAAGVFRLNQQMVGVKPPANAVDEIMRKMTVDAVKLGGVIDEGIKRTDAVKDSLRRLASGAGDTRFELQDLRTTFDDLIVAWFDGFITTEQLTRAQNDYARAVDRVINKGKDQRRILQQISTVVTDLARNLVDLVLPRFGGGSNAAAENQARLFDTLADAADDLARKGFSQPLAALDQFIARIRAAGSDAEANAIGLRAFGESGIELAAIIRRGGPDFDKMLERLRVTYPLTKQASEELRKMGTQSGILSKLGSAVWEVGRGIARIATESALSSTTVTRFLTSMLQHLGNILKHIPMIGNAFGRLSRISSTAFDYPSVQKMTKSVNELTTALSKQLNVIGAPSAQPAAGAPAGVNAPVLGQQRGGVAGVVEFIANLVTAIAGVASLFQGASQLQVLRAISLNTLQAGSGAIATADAVNKWLPSVEGLNSIISQVTNNLLAQINDALRIDLSSRISEVRDAILASSGFALSPAMAEASITMNVNFSGISGMQGAQEVAENLVRFLELKGVRVRK